MRMSWSICSTERRLTWLMPSTYTSALPPGAAGFSAARTAVVLRSASGSSSADSGRWRGGSGADTPAQQLARFVVCSEGRLPGCWSQKGAIPAGQGSTRSCTILGCVSSASSGALRRRRRLRHCRGLGCNQKPGAPAPAGSRCCSLLRQLVLLPRLMCMQLLAAAAGAACGMARLMSGACSRCRAHGFGLHWSLVRASVKL